MGNQLSTPQYVLHSNVMQNGSSKRKVNFVSYKGLPSKKYKIEVKTWTKQGDEWKCLPLLQYLDQRERMGVNPTQFHHKVKAKAGMITTFYSTS